MTFPASKITLADGLNRALRQAESIKAIAGNANTYLAANSVTSGYLLSLLDNMIGANNVLTQASGLSGMDTFAQAQLGQSIASDFTAMMNAITAAGGWIVTNFPKDGSGYLLAATFDASGNRVERSFTTTQTAGLRTLLAALVATIG